jgi:hypothetical protein
LNVHERISRLSCEPLYATNTSHRKQETFLYEYSLHWVFLPTENAQLFSSVVYSSSTVVILTTETSLSMRVHVCCLDCHEAGLCCYLEIHIENLLHLFTSICVLFTVSLSYCIRKTSSRLGNGWPQPLTDKASSRTLKIRICETAAACFELVWNVGFYFEGQTRITCFWKQCSGSYLTQGRWRE